jgi:hypothetical protein
MPKTSKQKRFFYAVKNAKHNPNYGDTHLHKVADSMTDSDIDDFTKLKAELKMKKAVLAVLKDSRGPIAETNDGTDDKKTGDQNVITKKFQVEGKFDEYVKRFLGQRFSEKELEAVSNFKEVKPKIESNLIRYNTTDTFQNSTTTIIKKLREGSDFVYVAFTKNDKPESPTDQQQPEGAADSGIGGSMGGMGGSPMMEDLGATDQPTPSNDMSVPTNPDFGSGTAPYEESKEYFRKFLPKNETKTYVNWPEKLNEQMPMDPMGATPPMGAQPGITPGPIPGQGPATTTAPMTPSPKTPEQRKKEMGVDDIIIRKSSTFREDIDGGRILIAFIKKLDL